ncbi:MAG: hypothetical protein V9H26_18450 [Verrucomicrobiota bacterium]|jgi:hypothetical protein|nr:hypothetical protein [Verrucomicrobiota bacterium]MCC6820138.1 hypothetical protein [Limisphaerales bacterium]
MAKNRKNQSVAIRFGPAIKALLLCSLFVAAGVGYVWQKSLIAELGQQMKTRETELVRFHDQNKKLREQLAGLTSPEALNERVRILKLGLELPKSDQVLRLIEPAGQPPGRPATLVKQYAARP